jgi:DNA replication protein DnaC
MDQVSVLFDEFEHTDPVVPVAPRGIVARWTLTALRIISGISLWTAVITAAFIVLRPTIRSIIGGPLPFSIKSAVPLIAIGISYISLVLTLRRKPGQLLVGVLMGLAFALWGWEQFLKDRALASFIDDCVVFLFVTDLSIVIRQNFRECAGERRLRKACLPARKTIKSFNFSAQPSLDEALIRTLLEGNYMERRENVLIVGNSGTGKTHLATALGHAACMQGKEVFFTTSSALVSDLMDAYGSRRLRHFHRRLEQLDLLIIDDVGYSAFSEMEAHLFFEVLRAGYERRSVVIATTVPLEKWGGIFGSEPVAKAAADRLSDRGHLLKASGDSYWKPGRTAVATPKFRAC